MRLASPISSIYSTTILVYLLTLSSNYYQIFIFFLILGSYPQLVRSKIYLILIIFPSLLRPNSTFSSSCYSQLFTPIYQHIRALSLHMSRLSQSHLVFHGDYSHFVPYNFIINYIPLSTSTYSSKYSHLPYIHILNANIFD